MKNFKRVISAVIALAMSASTLVAVSASKFADVDGTNYAEAIEVLTALDIVHGYDEEGGLVFKPEGDITRAEAATMIVGALNMTADAQAAAGTSKFTDVNEKASWASGYVNVGVAQGFINGMDDTTFAPQENVTYAQMCVMLTLITGYGEYAKAYGGYPTGYTTMAASAGINKGVALSADAKLKRGQVAQMLYNALTAPLLGVKSYSLAGNEYEPQDGSKGDFKTLLSDKFDGYVIDAKITAVPNSDPTLDKGEAKISTTKAAGEFLDNSTTKTVLGNEKVFDEYGVADQLFLEGKAVITQDNDDKWHLVYFKAGANDSTVAAAIDYNSAADGGKDASVDGKISFGSKNYNVNNTTGEIYVNGVLYGPITEANIAAVLGAAQGEVKLLDDDDTTTGYDKIMATVYNVAKVTAVTYTNEITTIQVTTKAGLNAGVNTLKISDDAVEDGSVALTAKNAAGETIALSSIKKNDIIAFAIDPGIATTTVTDPDFIDILVTDEKVSGKVIREDNTDKTYTVGDVTYEEVVWGNPVLTIGYTYSLTLDPFGKIYEEEVEASSIRYGIAETYNNYDGLQVILSDGSYKWYELNLNSIADPANVSGLGTTLTVTQFDNYIDAGAKPDPEARVIAYTVQNSTGKINKIDIMSGINYTAGNEAVYKSKTGKLGTKSIVDSTAVIDVIAYKANGTKTVSDYEKFATSSFVDKAEYCGTVFADQADPTIAALVLLTKIGDDLTEDSRFAVVRKAAAQAQTSDGDTCYSLNVLYDGEEKDILCTTASGVNTLTPGDAIFFKEDSEGLVKSYIKVFDITAYNNTNTVAFSDFDTLDGDADGEIAGTNGENFSFTIADWDYTIKNAAKADYQLVYGIVTDVTTKGVEMAVEAPVNFIDLTNDNNYEVFGVDADCVQYRYGMSEYTGAANQYKGISVAAPQASVLDPYETGTKTDIFDLSQIVGVDGHDQLVYALAQIVDGDIVAIYTLVQ